MVQDSTVVFLDSVGGYYCVCGADAGGVAQVGGDGNALISGNAGAETRASLSASILKRVVMLII